VRKLSSRSRHKAVRPAAPRRLCGFPNYRAPVRRVGTSRTAFKTLHARSMNGPRAGRGWCGGRTAIVAYLNVSVDRAAGRPLPRSAAGRSRWRSDACGGSHLGKRSTPKLPLVPRGDGQGSRRSRRRMSKATVHRRSGAMTASTMAAGMDRMSDAPTIRHPKCPTDDGAAAGVVGPGTLPGLSRPSSLSQHARTRTHLRSRFPGPDGEASRRSIRATLSTDQRRAAQSLGRSANSNALAARSRRRRRATIIKGGNRP